MTWWVYIIEADDGSLYTGITTDVGRRFGEHAGMGGAAGQRRARYFNGRSPVAVVFTERQPGRAEALRREAAIKRLKRTQKQKLVLDFIEFR